MSQNFYLKFVQWIFLFLGITIFGSFWFIVAGYFWKRRHSRENKYPYLPVIVGVLGGLLVRYECNLHYGPIVIGWVWMGIGLVGFLVTLRLANTKNKDVALQQKNYPRSIHCVTKSTAIVTTLGGIFANWGWNPKYTDSINATQLSQHSTAIGQESELTGATGNRCARIGGVCHCHR